MTDTKPQAIRVRIDEHAGGARIAHVTIDNARRLNSLNSALMSEFVGSLEALPHTVDGLRAVVLSGAGDKAFVGGADIDEMAALTSPDEARAFITRVHRCCHAVRELPVPVIARLQGFTLGAGLELAAACDLRVAADTAQFGMPEVKLGIPSVVEAALLPGLVGWGRAREMLLLGENFGAAEALAWGMVERVVPADALDAVVEGWIASLLHTGAHAVRLQKQLIRRWEDLPMRDAVRAGIDAFAAAWDSDEPARMMGEFQAGRKSRRAARD
ncbi:MAG: enoyl-CoA hydratase [Gammaproteobacteria bacterium]